MDRVDNLLKSNYILDDTLYDYIISIVSTLNGSDILESVPPLLDSCNKKEETVISEDICNKILEILQLKPR